jgi:hypothetical protein
VGDEIKTFPKLIFMQMYAKIIEEKKMNLKRKVGMYIPQGITFFCYAFYPYPEELNFL